MNAGAGSRIASILRELTWTAALLALALMLVAPAPGLGQDDPPPTSGSEEQEEPATPEGSNVGYEEEVTVTAGKRGEETIQSFNSSIAAPSE
jgi:hypothetical protein